MNYPFNQMAQQGWQCPVCKSVYSPSTPMCMRCKPIDNVVYRTGVPDGPASTGGKP